jgi:uncharacterized protein with PIN domain
MQIYVDAMLGKLGRTLRILGYDTLIADPKLSDKAIMETVLKEKRILITGDKEFFNKMRKQKYHDKEPTIAVLINEKTVMNQLASLFTQLKLEPELLETSNSEKFIKRCSICNSKVTKVEKNKIKELINPGTYKRFNSFWLCSNSQCQKIYWIGSHWKNILTTFDQVRIQLYKP